MRRKYLLSDKELWIDVISLVDLKYDPIYATPISASGLKKYLHSNYVKEVFITSTLPNVYIQTGTRLFLLSYRPFLSFLSHLYEIEDFVELNWLIDGF
jgi:hypothetical protein